MTCDPFARLPVLPQTLHPYVFVNNNSINRPDTVKWRGDFAHSFSLDNGAEQLSRWFAHVSLRRYADELIVNEAGPLVAYVLSGLFGASFSDAQSTQFRRFVEDEIAARGAIRITKDSGLFEAY